MDLRQLRYFVTVVQERNFTRAAERLHIAQPPLSRQIQQLEAELGTRLLVRSSRPIRATEAGRLFHEEALQVLGRVDQMKETARRVGRSERPLLTVGFVASLLYAGLPLLVRRLRQLHPELDIRLVEVMSGSQNEELKAGRIDVGFGRVRREDPGITRLLLREEQLALAVPPAHPLAVDTSPIRPAALAGQALIVYPGRPRPSFADQVLSLLHDHAVRPDSVQEVSELQTALGLVAAETGLCIVPRSAGSLRQDLHYRIIDDEHAVSPIIMSCRRSDESEILHALRRQLMRMHAEPHPWLAHSRNLLTEQQAHP